MGTITDIKEHSMYSQYRKFYKEMDSETIKGVIMYSYNQGDFSKTNSWHEKARLRALASEMLSREKQDTDYITLLESLVEEVN